MSLVVIAHNIRSTYNVGAILRSCDGFGVERLYCTGYTPYPELPDDQRPPHIRQAMTRQIHKTALGAELSVPIEYASDPGSVISMLWQAGFTIAALEQDTRSILLNTYHPPAKLALLLGEEVGGVPLELRNQADVLLEIPMRGQKESFNVSVATGIALYVLSSAA